MLITSGCKNIGNGAVVGAGSIVTHDVEPYTIVAGNPDMDTINELERSQWYNYPPKELYKYYNMLNNPNEFTGIILQEHP